jgi:hypothetical protein
VSLIDIWESSARRRQKRWELKQLAKAQLRVARFQQGVTSPSLLDRLDPRFAMAIIIIGLFAWAFARTSDRDTQNLMTGALIAAFAGAWGYYLGSSNGAAQIRDSQEKTIDLARKAVSALPSPNKPDVVLEPGETAQASQAGEAKNS